MNNENKSPTGCGIFALAGAVLLVVYMICAALGDTGYFAMAFVVPALLAILSIKLYLELDERITTQQQSIADLEKRIIAFEQELVIHEKNDGIPPSLPQ